MHLIHKKYAYHLVSMVSVMLLCFLAMESIAQGNAPACELPNDYPKHLAKKYKRVKKINPDEWYYNEKRKAKFLVSEPSKRVNGYTVSNYQLSKQYRGHKVSAIYFYDTCKTQLKKEIFYGGFKSIRTGKIIITGRFARTKTYHYDENGKVYLKVKYSVYHHKSIIKDHNGRKVVYDYERPTKYSRKKM